jgi:hypothetical protein
MNRKLWRIFRSICAKPLANGVKWGCFRRTGQLTGGFRENAEANRKLRRIFRSICAKLLGNWDELGMLRKSRGRRTHQGFHVVKWGCFRRTGHLTGASRKTNKRVSWVYRKMGAGQLTRVWLLRSSSHQVLTHSLLHTMRHMASPESNVHLTKCSRIRFYTQCGTGLESPEPNVLTQCSTSLIPQMNGPKTKDEPDVLGVITSTQS